MKVGIQVAAFAILLVYGLFAVIHYEYAKSAGGYNFWLYSGITALVIAVLIAVVGFIGQGKRKV